MDIMKKILYFLLLIAEFVVGCLLMMLAWANTFEIACVVTGVIWAALIVWQIISLTKATDAGARKKIKRNVALVMLIPTAAFILMLVWLIVGLMSVI